MKYLIFLLLIGCKTITLNVRYCNGTSEIRKIRSISVCLINFNEDTSIWYLANKNNRILLDSVCDYRVLKVGK